MAYQIEFSKSAKKDLKKLPLDICSRIDDLIFKLQSAKDPTLLGQPLKGTKSHLWRYRVGDYRVICEIDKEVITIFVIRIGHRKDIYKK